MSGLKKKLLYSALFAAVLFFSVGKPIVNFSKQVVEHFSQRGYRIELRQRLEEYRKPIMQAHYSEPYKVRVYEILRQKMYRALYSDGGRMLISRKGHIHQSFSHEIIRQLGFYTLEDLRTQTIGTYSNSSGKKETPQLTGIMEQSAEQPAITIGETEERNLYWAHGIIENIETKESKKIRKIEAINLRGMGRVCGVFFKGEKTEHYFTRTGRYIPGFGEGDVDKLEDLEAQVGRGIEITTGRSEVRVYDLKK